MSEGLYQKYIIQKNDGSPVDPNAQYFVLRIDTDPNARKAVLRYASLISESDPGFADALYQWVMKYMPADERNENR
jgi:hypothetical protein